ncbi:MAG: HEPN domain-containing protein [Pseudomonadota bacterium]
MKEERAEALVTGRLEQARTALEDAAFLMEGNRSTLSIVNRSYYAMFYAALALLQTIGKAPSKHVGVISLFDTEFVLTGKLPRQLSKDFHKAFELRQVSDYRIEGPCTKEKAATVLAKAAGFVEAVSSYLGWPSKLDPTWGFDHYGDRDRGSSD